MVRPTIKLYYVDPALRKTTARVVAVECGAVILDQTIFYPEGGGQEGDQGYIGPIRVQDTQKRGGTVVVRPDLPEVAVHTEVVHVVDDDVSNLLAPGDEVELTVDATRREGCTKLHGGAHVVLARFEELFGATSFVLEGCHISPTQARLDLRTELKLSGTVLDDLQGGVNAWIDTDAPVEMRPVPDVSEMFIWHSDLNPHLSMPCGGTHAARLGALGHLRLKRRRMGKNLERIYILAATEPEGHV
jgi:alanyl-tRNA synthetase